MLHWCKHHARKIKISRVTDISKQSVIKQNSHIMSTPAFNQIYAYVLIAGNTAWLISRFRIWHPNWYIWPQNGQIWDFSPNLTQYKCKFFHPWQTQIVKPWFITIDDSTTSIVYWKKNVLFTWEMTSHKLTVWNFLPYFLHRSVLSIRAHILKSNFHFLCYKTLSSNNGNRLHTWVQTCHLDTLFN